MAPASRLGKKSVRVLAYLETARTKTSNLWQADDYQVAWQTVRLAALGHLNPWHEAWIAYYGKTLAKSLAYWAERDLLTAQALERCQLMAEEDQRLRALPPKKAAQSERDSSRKRKDRQA